MPGNHSRVKGRAFEQEVARALRPVFPKVARAWEASEGKGYDLENTGRLDIQCKRYKRAVPMSKLKEVPVRKGRIAVLAARSDHSEAMVALRLTDFIRLLQDVGEAFDDAALGLGSSDEWWLRSVQAAEEAGAVAADAGVFEYPHESVGCPADEELNLAYERGHKERRKQLGDKFKWK